MNTTARNAYIGFCRLMIFRVMSAIKGTCMIREKMRMKEIKMDLTREEALRLHRQMWGAMQRELGDNPSEDDRGDFKELWCEEHFPNEKILSNCFLCEYVKQISPGQLRCYKCPINWGENESKFNCQGRIIPGNNMDYRYDAISKILALPERNERK